MLNKILILLVSLSSVIFAKGPANDHFASALELTGEKYPYKARGCLTDNLDRFRATKEDGEPNHAGTSLGHSIWYCWTAPRTQKMRIYTYSKHHEMKLVVAVYTGHAVNDLTLAHRYADFAFPAISRTASEPFTRHAYLQFEAVEGTKYYIAVDTENAVFKPFQLLLHTYRNPFKPRLELMKPGSKWEYLLARNDQGDPVDPKSLDPDFYQTWMFPERYHGPAFNSGQAPIGYGSLVFGQVRSNLGEKRNYLPSEGKRHTVYLRSSFTPPIDVTSLGIEGIIDDGAIVYLNGKEVLRYNVAPGKNPQDWKAPAKDHMANQWSETESFILTQEISNLNLPANVPVNIAISLHNHTPADDDLGMDVRLYALTPKPDGK